MRHRLWNNKQWKCELLYLVVLYLRTLFQIRSSLFSHMIRHDEFIADKSNAANPAAVHSHRTDLEIVFLSTFLNIRTYRKQF